MNVSGVVPFHEPFWTVSMLPTVGVPLTVGGCVFAGAVAARVVEAAPTAANTASAATSAPASATGAAIAGRSPPFVDPFIVHSLLRWNPTVSFACRL